MRAFFFAGDMHLPTDFPKKGDDKKVTLRNSEYPQFSRSFAENLKADHPDIWAKGGNIRGNEAYEYWGKARAGDDSDGVIDWIKEREAWAARHFEDFRIAGVIAQIKWGVIGSRGQQYMKDLVKQEIAKKTEDKSMGNEVKNFAGTTKAIGDRQIRVVVSTGDVDREGDIIEPNGIDFTAYRKNPVVLFQHDHDTAIATCTEIGVVKGRVEAVAQFPPEGASPKSDEVYNLIKAGVLNASSIGFIPKTWEPIEGSKFSRRFTTCECLEWSVVSVPANANALILERKMGQQTEEKRVSLWNLEEMLEVLRALSWLTQDQRRDETYDDEGEYTHFGAEMTAWLNEGQRLFAAMASALPEAKSLEMKAAMAGETKAPEQEPEGKAEMPAAEEPAPEAKAEFVPCAECESPDACMKAGTCGDMVEEDGCGPKKSALGLIGESGPEAVLPLTRGANGAFRVVPVRIDEKAGAVLSKTNKEKLGQCKGLIDEVLGSAEAPAAEETPAKAARSKNFAQRQIELLRLRRV